MWNTTNLPFVAPIYHKPSNRLLRMKAKKHNQFLAALSMVGFTLTVSLAHAANLYWDGGSADIVANGDGVSAGTAGTWNTTLLNWDQGNALAHVAWNNANNDTAIFGGATAGAISITAPITVGGLTFTRSGYTFTGAENVSIATNGVLTGSAGATSPVTNLVLAAGNTVYRVANPAATFGNTNTFTVGSILTGASNSVEATGTGLIVISASSTYKGTTTITPGATLRYDGVMDNIGTIGTRDITVGAGGSIMRTGGLVNNAFLNRLAENNNDITIYMGNANNANNLDFSSSTGANLPNASIAFYDSAGTPSFQYTGTITPANNTYRLGGTKASAANNTSLPNVNALTGARSVVVTGGNVRILNSNDFTGTITINAGNFNISGNVNASNATVSGNGSIGGGTYAGDITTNGAMIHSSSATQTLSGLITGSGSVSRGSPGTAAPSGSTATPIDAGTLILTNPNNAYTGITSASTGTISFNSIANVGGGVSSLGAPTTITNGTIPVGGAFLTFRTSVPIITPRSGTLVYTGNGHISDRVIDLAGTSGGATINSSGGGALELTSNMTATGIGSKTLTLSGSNSNNNRIGGAIVNNSTSGSTTLSKSFEAGANTVTLSSVDGISTGATITGTGIAGSTTITAINSATKIVTLSANTNATANNSIVGTYAITGVQNRTSLAKEGAGKWVLGGTNTFTGSTTVSGGTLMLDYSINDNSKLADAGILTMAGGNLDLSGGTHTEIVVSTTLAAGTASSVTSSTPGSVLQMGLITTNPGASINFSAPSIATTDTTNTNGILGAWATVGTDWATNSTNAALGPITAYTGYADIDARGPSTIADGASTNVRIAGDGTSGNVELGAITVTINTLLQNNATFAATINTASKNLITDAIWIPAGKAGLVLGTSAEDGTLSPKVAGGNLLLQNDGSNDLTINAVLIDNSTSFIAKAGTGTVTLNATNTYAGGTFLSAGALVIGNSSALGTGPLNITGGSVAATGTQVTTNLVNANGDFAIAGTGALTLGNMTANANRIITNNNTTAVTTFGPISGATRNLTFSGNGNTIVAGVIGTTTGTLTKNGLGTLTLTASNSYSGVTTISGGTLQIGDGVTDGAIASTANIINNAALVYNNTNSLTVNKVISGTGSLTQKGTANLTLSATNTFTGQTIISDGTLSVGVTANLGAPAANLVFDGGALQITGTALTSFSGIGHTVSFNTNKNVDLDIANANNTFIVDQVLNQGTGWFYKYGLGTAILTQANTMMPSGGTDYNGVAQGMLLATKFTAMPGIANDLWYAETGAILAVRADDAGTNDEFTSANLDSLLGGAGTTDAFASGSYLGIEVIGSSTFTYAGNIAGTSAVLDNVGKGLVKLGTGTLALTGVNTYTDTTSVRAGTLALIGGSHTSAITLSAGASLGFTLGSPTTTTQDVNISLGTIKITGTPTLASYDLITSSGSINGTPVLASPISGYELKVESNVLKLKKAGYASWASTNTAGPNLNDDHDNDGVANGIEYFLGGPTGNTTGFTTLPSVVKALDGTLSVTWPKGSGYAGVYNTDYVVETSATLTGVWTAETIGGGNITDSGASVKFTFPGGPAYSGKNFARLRVTGP
jgi:fibronectin-binding autotransporter adhesin